MPRAGNRPGHSTRTAVRELARLFRDDRAKFDRRYEAGRLFFHGPDDSDDDAWLDALYGCVEAEAAGVRMGLRSWAGDDGFREVWVYPTPVELVGGRHDGAVVVPGFSLDLEHLRAAFESVVACGWNALGLTAPEGPHVSIEGVFRGREVVLQVLAQAPDDEDPIPG